MATIKSYSDLQQSKKLAEILPLESADMCYGINDGTLKYNDLPWLIPYHKYTAKEFYVPCWSLASLLGVLPFPVLYMEMLAGMILWSCECHFIETKEVVKIEHYDNPVDACYELILKLHELKVL